MLNTNLRLNGNRIIEHDIIKAKIGYTNKHNHNVFHIEGGVFVKPLDNAEDFSEIMDCIKKRCRNYIKQTLNNNTFLSNDFLTHFEICSQRMKQNKKSYLSFQYHFKQNNNNNQSIIELKEEKDEFFKNILKNIEQELNNENIKIFKYKTDLT